MKKDAEKEVCMACACPCEMHTVHTHDVEPDDDTQKEMPKTTCVLCGHVHHEDGTCDCGCK